MYNEPIYTLKELAEEYTKKRKGITAYDVEDLMRCLIMFMKHNKEYFYVEIPEFATLFKELEEDKYINQVSLNDYAALRELLEKPRKDHIKLKTKEELEKWQNS